MLLRTYHPHKMSFRGKVEAFANFFEDCFATSSKISSRMQQELLATPLYHSFKERSKNKKLKNI